MATNLKNNFCQEKLSFSTFYGAFYNLEIRVYYLICRGLFVTTVTVLGTWPGIAPPAAGAGVVEEEEVEEEVAQEER